MRNLAAVLFCVLISSESGLAQQATVPFSFNGGGFVFGTEGRSANAIVGYSRVQQNGSGSPAGLEIFGYRQNNVLISEAAVPAASAITRGRIYAEIIGATNTGIAIANPNTETVSITFYFTDSSGQTVGSGNTTIAANAQIARFLDQAPFNGVAPMRGTFTFTSSLPVAAIALRGFTNERSEFLITTLPVADLNALSSAPVIFPHYVDGAGWTTQIILVNPTDTILQGTIQFHGTVSLASLESLTFTTQFNTFRYDLLPRSSIVLQTAGTAATTAPGWIVVTPIANHSAPSGIAVFSFKQTGVTVTQTGVPMLQVGSAFRIYSETVGIAGERGSVLTGVAIANPSAFQSITVNFELLTLNGDSTGMTGSLELAPSGQMAAFLGQIKGFEGLRPPFQGILAVSTSQLTGMAVVGLRGRYNERGDFLIATTAPIAESAANTNAELFFPHVVDGGGYTSQFILFGKTRTQAASGSVNFISQSGNTLSLNMTFSPARRP